MTSVTLSRRNFSMLTFIINVFLVTLTLYPSYLVFGILLSLVEFFKYQ